MNFAPFIKPRFSTTAFVMLDVIIALIPLSIISWLAFGAAAVQIIIVSVVTCFITDLVFSALILRKAKFSFDISPLITGLLLAYTVSPLTPWCVICFGAFTAIFFGKVLWGGIGKNRFNPALVGREFMTVYFYSVMTSPSIWKTNSIINIKSSALFSHSGFIKDDSLLQTLVYNTDGALGEYSMVCIVLGGFYLLMRKRISWHIPFSVFSAFILFSWLIPGSLDFKFSVSGLLLGAIYMATDMPSSPVTSYGKIYYGCMIGFTAFLFIFNGINFEYMSYSILLLNGFCTPINNIFTPNSWGEKQKLSEKLEKAVYLTLLITVFAFAIASIYRIQMIHYIIYLFIVYTILKFNRSFSKKIDHPI